MNVEPQHLTKILRLKMHIKEGLRDWVLFPTVCFGVRNIMPQLP